MVEKLLPDLFLKNQNWAYLWINSLKFYTSCFYCMPSSAPSKYIETKLRTTCIYLNSFLKTKRGLELVSLCHFPHDFWRKIFPLLYFINRSTFTVWLPLLPEILNNMFILIVYKSGCDVINFEVHLIFLIKPFFLRWSKSQGKDLENENNFQPFPSCAFQKVVLK